MRHGAGWAKERFGEARVARFATVGADGSPHLVPITFALVGENLVSAVDASPSRRSPCAGWTTSPTTRSSCVLVDAYDDDWSQLWWARADGWARVVSPDKTEGFDQLVAKYEQYRIRPPDGPAVVIAINHWSGWSAS